MPSDHNTVLGARGEQAVADWYQARGFEVVDRNWRSSTGEIDLVVKDSNLVVVCEVKTRTSERFGSPAESITRAKLGRLRRLAAEWLRHARSSGVIAAAGAPRSGGVVVRVDVACVMPATRGSCDLVVDVIEAVI